MRLFTAFIPRTQHTLFVMGKKKQPNAKKITSSSSVMAATSSLFKFDLAVAPVRGDKPPFGFVRGQLSKGGVDTPHTVNEQPLLALKTKRAMAMGQAPGEVLMLTCFMLWMLGSSLHISSIMFVGLSVITPIKALGSVQAYFKPMEQDQVNLAIPKLTYIVLNLLALAIAMYKCHSMGLLPLSSTDWVSLVPVPVAMEYVDPWSALL